MLNGIGLSGIKNRTILVANWPRFVFSLAWKIERNLGTWLESRGEKRGKICFVGGGRIAPIRRILRSLIRRFSPRLNKGGQARRRIGRNNIVAEFPSVLATRYPKWNRCDKLSLSIFSPPLFSKSWNAWKRNDSIVLSLSLSVKLFTSIPSTFDSNISRNGYSSSERERKVYAFLFFSFFENFSSLANWIDSKSSLFISIIFSSVSSPIFNESQLRFRWYERERERERRNIFYLRAPLRK